MLSNIIVIILISDHFVLLLSTFGSSNHIPWLTLRMVLIHIESSYSPFLDGIAPPYFTGSIDHF